MERQVRSPLVGKTLDKEREQHCFIIDKYDMDGTGLLDFLHKQKHITSGREKEGSEKSNSPFFWEEKENKSVTEDEGEWRLTFLDTLTWVYLAPQSTVTF